MDWIAWKWIIFNGFVLAMLALDLGVFHRKAHVVHFKEAVAWSIFWIALALIFNLGLWWYQGPQPATEFLTGYLIEKSLSVDNIFVFVVIFTYFRVSPMYQHRVLFWGILGALVMRGIFIAAGVVLIKQFHWMIYIFGGFLILTGIKMIVQHGKEMHPEQNPVVRWARKVLPMTSDYRGGHFWVRESGKLLATPLFLVLLLVETTDLIFAVDSIPAILAITQDPFIVYTSNVFAILGLRALYFALAGVVGLFHLLGYGLAGILMFVGTKMLLVDVYKIPILVSLAVIAVILTISVVASILWPKKETHALVGQDPHAAKV